MKRAHGFTTDRTATEACTETVLPRYPGFHSHSVPPCGTMNVNVFSDERLISNLQCELPCPGHFSVLSWS